MLNADNPTSTIKEGQRVVTKGGIVAVAVTSSYIARSGKEVVQLHREGDISKRYFRSQVSAVEVVK